MAPFVRISKRVDTVGSTGLPVVAWIGFGVAGLLVVILAVWLSVRAYRRKAKKKREDDRGAAFLTVKGIVKDSVSSVGPLPADLLAINQPGTKGFSRANLTPSIVLPNKAIIRSDATKEEIISYHEEQGNLPRPFAPFSFALNAANGSSSSTLVPPSSRSHTKGGASIGTIGSILDSYSDSPSRPTILDNRLSTASFSASAARIGSPGPHARNSSRFSAMYDSIRGSFLGFGHHAAAAMRPGSMLSSLSGTSSMRTHSRSGSALSGLSVAGGGVHIRKVRQLFTPILPDEPTLALGERVAIVRSFDDGWVIIARDRPYGPPGDVELGTVPSWCFVKPMKGLRSERPVRSTSLGVTVNVDWEGPGPEKREDYISWSNF